MKSFLRFTLLLFLAVFVAACGTPAPGSPEPVRNTIPPRTGQAQTYYVATNGQDVIPGGTSDQPWRTLQFAVDNVLPGDTILVRSGEYVGCRIEQSGTAGAWLTLQAEPGASVRVTAPGSNNRHDSNIEVETWEGDGTVAYWTIAGLEVSGAPSWGIDVRGNETVHSHDLVVRGNTVHDNGLATGRTGIFFAFVDDATVEYNESYNNGEHGIYWSNSGDRPVIRGNVLHNNAGCGVHMNGDASMGGDGVISGALVEKNVIYENGTAGGAGINMDGVENSLIRNNLLYANHAGGITMYQIDGGACSHGDSVLNNTILMPADGRWAVNIADPGCTDNRLANNVLYTDHAYRGSITIHPDALNGFQSDYNVVVDRFSADGDSSVISLAEWQALGFDLHSFISTPEQLFIDPTSSDYHLRSGSLAIDAGTALSEVSDDLEGNPRPAGAAYDIGAFESQPSGFTLEVEPASRSIAPGDVATYTVYLQSTGGWTGTVTLLTASPSSSLTVQVSPTDVVVPGIAALTAQDHHVSPLLPGLSYSLPVTATADAVTLSASVGLVVGGTRIYLPGIFKGASSFLKAVQRP